MARPKGSHDIAPELRGGFKRAILQLEAKGKPLSDIWMSLIEDDPANALRIAVSLCPKQIEAEVTTRSIEDFVSERATLQAADDSTAKTQLQ